MYALLPATERTRMDAQLRDIVSRMGLKGGLVAVGSVVDRVDELPRARRRVDRLLALRGGRDAQPGDIVHVDEERDNLVFAEIADGVRDIDALQAGAVSRIAEYDRDHGTAYVPTLRAWFESSGDVAAAAARLYVHANTFRYRMTRAGELFGLRLDQPDERLLLHLQLRLADWR
jgi:sugar diacid utilization regulator